MANNASLYNMYLNEFLPLLLIPFISNSVKRKSDVFDKVLGMFLLKCTLFMHITYHLCRVCRQAFVYTEVPYTIAFIAATLAIGWFIYHYFDRL